MSRPSAEPSSPSAGVWVTPAVVFVLSMLVTSLLCAWIWRAIESQDRARFDSEVMQTMTAIRERIEKVVALLDGAAGLFAASENVSATEFASFARRMQLAERYPGILGIGYTLRIAPEDLARTEDNFRVQYDGVQLDRPFHVWPPGPRDEYYAIVFLQPMDARNREALGFDMSSEQTRRAAMIAARDSGEPRASGKVTLVQEIEIGKQAGFLIYLPVYAGHEMPADIADRRARLAGFVYAPLRADDLLKGARDGRPVDYALYDGAQATPDHLLRSTAGPVQAAPRFKAQRTLDVAGRPWLVEFRTSPEFDTLSRSRLRPGLLLLALGTSALLAYIALAQGHARHAAEAASRDQRERSRRLQRLAEATPTLAASISERQLLQDIETAACQLVGAPRAAVHMGPEPEAAAEGLAVPLVDGSGRLGTVHVALRAGEPYGPDDRLLLEQLGGLAGVALRNARLYADLRESDERKDQFLATLAHELRNPLAPIRTSLEIVRQAPGSPAAAHALEVAQRQTRHMVRLIEDLLDVSRISRGTILLRREPVRLAEVVETAVEISRPLIESRHHRLDVPAVAPDLAVLGDATRLAQVFANLLHNAATYTPPGGRIAFSIEATGRHVDVAVSDNGIGIETHMLERVFDMFTQVERADSAGGGLGIGLTLVRNLVGLHGGTVHARSEGPGRGARFVVCLPLADTVPAPAAPPGVPAASERASLHVLVVDDNRDAAESLAVMLELDGHRVDVAHDGPSALELARGARHDVALLDIGLPGMSGYELARRLRALPSGDRVRLVAITGWGQADDRRRAAEAGFELHMVKPVDYETLAGHLRRLTAGRVAG